VDLTELLTENIHVMHAFLAELTGKEIFRLEQSESDQLAGAINNVARHYNPPKIAAVTADWIRLGRVVGQVYGGRIFAARMMRAAELKETPTPKPPADKPRIVETIGQDPMPGPRIVKASPGPGLPDVEVLQP
jgi:hypothetical protein